MNPALFLLGYRQISCGAPYSAALLELCMRGGYEHSGFRTDENGAVCFFLSLSASKRLARDAQHAGVRISLGESRGLPAMLWHYRCRAGLILGALLIVCLLFLAERFVWDVRVTGNERMTESEVLAELRACGFGIGSYIPSVQASSLENRVLLNSDRIAWLSIYLDGTVARVQVIERVDPPPQEDQTRPANLIAAVDGQIELVELYRGNCVVQVGQAVRAGELLVSGLYDSSIYGYRYTRAAGRILARTERTIRVEIPLQYTEKVYESEKYDEIYLKFFDYSLKVFKSVGNRTDTCDIIKEEINFSAFGSHTLPLGITLTKRLPYREIELERSPEQALALAYAELDRRMAMLSGQIEVLSKTVKTEIGEQSLVLECTIGCIEDIAVQTEFEMIE